MSTVKTVADYFDEWVNDVLSGKPPVMYPIAPPGHPLNAVEVGPEMVDTFAAPPGWGKTAIVSQMMTDALLLTLWLKVLVCNVEMTKKQLLNRQLSRLSRIDYSTIRMRRLGEEHEERRDAGIQRLSEIKSRLVIMDPPYGLENIAHTVSEFQPHLVILDYVQRIKPYESDDSKKSAVDEVAEFARTLAFDGRAVILVSAVSRQRDRNGNPGYGNLNMASLKESGEIEYASDNVYILDHAKDGKPGEMVLKAEKVRDAEPCELRLQFNGQFQSFDPIEDCTPSAQNTAAPSNTSAAAAVWKKALAKQAKLNALAEDHAR